MRRLAFLLCISLLSASSLAQGSWRDDVRDGRLCAPDGRAFPLKHTDVRMDISGPVARVTVRQVFVNPFTRPMEAVYAFPLPDQAAVDGFVMEIGSRRIVGEIRRIEEARRAYVAARSAGRTAALLTQERPNVFTQHVTNVLGSERITVEISYVEHLPYDKGWRSIVFPTTIGPRFHPASVKDGHRVPSGSGNDFATRPGNDISITATVDAGVDASICRSDTHQVSAKRLSPSRFTVKLAPQDTMPNRDFKLQWKVGGDEPTAAIMTHCADAGGYFTLMLQPPDAPPISLVFPREVFFVIDCSGSMRGQPLRVAKDVVQRTLFTLEPHDTFQILRFSDEASSLAAEPLPATRDNVRLALSHLTRLDAGGGTQMMRGVMAALAGERDRERLRVIHFITDGFIGNEPEVLHAIKTDLRGARMFPLGVGSSPNRYLIDRIARVGSGAAAFIAENATSEQVSKQVRAFVDRVRRPALVDLQIDWGGLAVHQMQPLRLPDLFVGQPLVIQGRYRQSGAGVVRISGRRRGATWEQQLRVTLPARNEGNTAIPNLWARARIRDLQLEQGANVNSELKEAITLLGIEHGLMTSYTAFLAIDHQVVNRGGIREVIKQPLVSPRGTADLGFDGTQENDAIGLGGGGGSAFGGRRGGRRNLRAIGGGGKTQRALDRGVGWFEQHQSPDGRWDSDGFGKHADPTKGTPSDGAGAADRDVAATSWVLLTYLGAGNTHREGPHKKVVRQGFKWLKNQQQRDGRFTTPNTSDADGQHAVAALAMAELYGMTKSGIWKGSAQAAIDRIVNTQYKDGGWIDVAGKIDQRLTVYSVLALRSATDAGLVVPADSLTRAHSVLVKNVTEAGVLARIFCGEDPGLSRPLKAALDAIAANPPVHADGKIDLDRWYFGTLAMFQAGGQPWKAWNEAMKAAVINHFRTDGNFNGSFDPVGIGPGRGRLESSALMTLCVEVYYRYARVFGGR